MIGGGLFPTKSVFQKRGFIFEEAKSIRLVMGQQTKASKASE